MPITRGKSGQFQTLFAFNRTTNQPVAGDDANITVQISIDNGSFVTLTVPNPTAMDINHPGYYAATLQAAETDGEKLLILAKSTTPNVEVISLPTPVFTETPGSNSGSGPFTHTVTVRDQANNLVEGVQVRYANGADQPRQVSDVNGIAVLNVFALTYSVIIKKVGYTFTPTTIAITSDGSHTWVITLDIVADPVDLSQCNCITYLKNSDGSPAVGATFQFRMEEGPSIDGESFDDSVGTSQVSDSMGKVIQPLSQGCSYRFKRGKGWGKLEVIPIAGTHLLTQVPLS